MAKITPLHAAAPPAPAVRSPEREALAAAIARHQAAAAELRRIEDGRRRFYDEVYWTALDQKTAALATRDALKADEGRIRATAFLGDKKKAEELAEAERAVVEANAAVVGAEETKSGLETMLAEAKEEFESAEAVIDRRHHAAVAADPAIAALISRYEALRREVAELSLSMSATYSFSPRGYDYQVYRDYGIRSSPEADVWKEAIAAMRHDADAPLPAAPSAG